MALTLYEHPLSPYAQKVKIALDEKGLLYELKLPVAIGSGETSGEFAEASPRGEVPLLVDREAAGGTVSVFDSSVILAYVEEKWPEPPLLPATPRQRARVRMIEDVMDTHYEANTWALGEIRAFGRATGARAQELEASAGQALERWHGWLGDQLGAADWFNGPAFGWGDLCVAPFVNGAPGSGFPPEPGTPLAAWLARANQRESVAKARDAALASAQASSGTGLDAVRQLLDQGLFKREYRDHRLEWMIRNGALDIVAQGVEKGNVRFVGEFGG